MGTQPPRTAATTEALRRVVHLCLGKGSSGIEPVRSASSLAVEAGIGGTSGSKLLSMTSIEQQRI
jgi:hypothetical protein